MNSISNIAKAIDYEVARQKEALENGEEILQETRRFDEKTGTTVLMRRKEGNVDYKFFPEPNIFPIRLDDAWIKEVQDSMSELPEERKARYQKEFGLSEHDIDVLIANKEMSEFFEEVMKNSDNAKAVCNWLLGDVSGWLNKHESTISTCDLQPNHLARLIQLVDEGSVSGAQAKSLVDDVMNGKDPDALVKEKNMTQVSDESELLTMVQTVLDENPQAIEDFKNGKDRAVGFLVGQVMKASKGTANPGLVNKILNEELKKK